MAPGKAASPGRRIGAPKFRLLLGGKGLERWAKQYNVHKNVAGDEKQDGRLEQGIRRLVPPEAGG